MCGCGNYFEDEELDEVIREVEEDEAIEVTEEFAIPVRIGEEVEVRR